MRSVMVVGVWIALGLFAPITAQAQERASWTEGDDGSRRVTHLVAATLGGLGYVATSVLKRELSAVDCRWCAPPSLDRAVRDALRWDDRRRGYTLSNVTGYLAAPLFSFGVTAFLAWDDAGAGASRLGRVLDDTLPIAESVVFTQLLVQAVKFSVARQRPRAYFAGGPPDPDDHEANLSFFSGHGALAFSLATSAGLVAHRRGSDAAPVIWAVGLTLATATGYLRIAADEHYLTDVVAGSLFGAGMGLLIPALFHPDDGDGDDENQPQQRGLLPGGSGLSYGGVF